MVNKKQIRVLIAADSFKDSLSSIQVSQAVSAGILSIYPDAKIDSIPLADGGEGTVDAFLAAVGGEKIYCDVFDPLMRPIKAFYGILNDKSTAVIELAAASGIECLTNEERNPLNTTSYGTGLLIRDALRKGCKRIIVGLGGSATNDGAIGMASALGAVFRDSEGEECGMNGSDLSRIQSIDINELKRITQDVEFLIACDVSNPLYGKNGAAHVYGPQKGANARMVELLDNGLKNYAVQIEKHLHISVADMPGAGAAGGAGAGLVAFFNGKLKPGFGLISSVSNLEERIAVTDVVITGEGKLDAQTLNGKAPMGVALLAKKHQKPVFAFAGQLGKDAHELLNANIFNEIGVIYDGKKSVEDCIKNAEVYLTEIVSKVFANFMAKSQNNQ